MQPDQNGRGTRAALFFAVAANVTGQSFLFMTLPALGRRLGISDIQTGALLSLSALLLIFAAPFWGWMSERHGRKRILLLALTGSSLGAVAYASLIALRLSDALSASAVFALLFGARILQALLVGGVVPSAQAFMADITPPSERVSGMGLIGGGYAVGGMSGALVAWGIAGDQPALAFGFTAAIVLLAMTVLARTREPRRPPPLDIHAVPPKLSGIAPFFFTTLLSFLAYSVVQQVMGLRLQDAFGYSPEAAITRSGAVVFTAAFGMAVMQAWGVRKLRWSPGRLVRIGGLTGAVALAACGFAPDYPTTLGALALFGVALGMIMPGNLTLLSLYAGRNAQGKTAGLNMVGQGLGLAIGPLTGAALYHISPQTPFFIATLLMACVCLIMRHRNVPPAAVASS